MPGVHLYGFDETTGLPVKCKVTAEGKLIINASGILENPPTEDEANKAPTSEWAFDHDADVAAHHAKFTAAEARAAINNIIGADGKLDGTFECDYNVMSALKQITYRYAGADNTWCTFGKNSGVPGIDISAYRSGVGFLQANFRLYDGSIWWDNIAQFNFSAELDNYLENPPTEDEANKAPTSEWAFDHDADVAAHHAKYTDAEAVGAFFARKLDLSTGTYTDQTVDEKSYILLDTSGGDITLKGLADGAYGQLIFCVKVSNANDVHIIHASGDAAAGDKIYCVTAGDESIAAGNYGCFWLVYQGGIWLVDHTLV